MSKESVEEERTPLGEKINAVISLASYPLGIVVGGMTMIVRIRNDLYKNFVRRGFFTDGEIVTDALIKEKNYGPQKQMIKEFQGATYQTLKERQAEGKEFSAVTRHFMHRYEKAHGLKQTVKHPGPVFDESTWENSGKKITGKLVRINDEYRKEVREFFKDAGLTKKSDYWKSITPNQRIEAAVTGFTFAAIAIGAALSISDHRTALEKLVTGSRRRKDTATADTSINSSQTGEQQQRLREASQESAAPSR